jgi:MFS family permease
MVVLGRVVQGVGAGILVVALNVLVGRGYPPPLRPRLYAAMSTAWVLPGVVGPALAGLVAEDLSWRLVFLAIVPAVIGAAAVALPAISRADAGSADGRSALPPTPRSAGVGAAVALAAGSALVLEALALRRVLFSSLLAVAGLALAVPALRAVLPRSSPAATGAGGQFGTMGVAALVNLAFFAAEAFLPLSLTSLHGRSVTEAGVVLTVAALTWTAGSWIQARTVAGIGPRRLCVVGLVLVAVGVAAVGALDWGSTPWWIGFVAWGVAGAGMGLSYPTTTLVVLSAAGSDRQGGDIAALEVLITLAVAIGAGVGGAALAVSISLGHGRAPGLRAVDGAAVVAALVGLALTVTVPRVVPGSDLAIPGDANERMVETAR